MAEKNRLNKKLNGFRLRRILFSLRKKCGEILRFENEKSITALLIYVFNLLVSLGYVILFPFEKIIKYISTLVKIILKKAKIVNNRYFVLNKRLEESYRRYVKSEKKRFLRIQKAFIKYISGISFKMPAIPEIRTKKRANAKKKKTHTKKSKSIIPKPFIHFILGASFVFFFIFIPYQGYTWFKNLPRPDLLSQINSKSTKILDRQGRLLYEIYVDRKYDPVPLVEIPNHLIQATLSIEDDSFYEHRGFRPLSILRAAKSTIIDKEIQGASTITQQLVKVALLTPERTIERKAKEVVLAYLVEGQYTKNEILELYLNNIPYGGTAWGVQAASQKFFGKNVWELDLAESSFLAGLPSAPTRNSPFNGGFDNAKSRQAQVLSRMLELGYINQQDAEVSYEKELAFAPQVEYIRAPHFVNYAVDELKATYGERMVNFGGLTVTTTLDLDLQDVVQEIVTSEVADNSNLNITNGASLVLDARLGEVLAYVGSVDYFSENDGEYDVVRAERSPGSSLKPVTYALALSNGHTPASVVTDAPLTIQSYGQTYSPKNYDNRYHGTVTLRQALANSYNIPAVKILKRVGIENMVELGKRMGLKTWELDSSYGWSITLGGKEVRLLDLANVYATFAREGMYKDITPFLSVKDINGFEIYKDKRAEEQVLNSDVAYLITNILSDNLARAPAFGYSNSLVVPDRTVAVKTGTSEEKRDNLTVGYTPTYVVAVWTGNNDNTPMHPQLSSGLSGAAPIWNRVMSYVLDGTENETFNRPDNIFVKIDSECKGKSEVFIKGTAPEHLCEVDKDKVDDKKRLTVIGGEF